jgi:hypothetical protein
MFLGVENPLSFSNQPVLTPKTRVSAGIGTFGSLFKQSIIDYQCFKVSAL